ncbi:hypothetical protein [Nocardiopsis kunsanensis]|uniref:Uncharacterized protein n=1 Tax=Nocardiopsis kunsanensis TaxID=141693 RepID=A0A918XEF2_9ACTN|nr:hypothetical protein [Nocardiopsis kunsanensis]GHD28152.1 hypothetical protein GCM10007147_27870 [Nocardiopsis kunsanensis]
MVLVGRGWPVLTGRADHGSNALVRLLLLSGIVAVAWLAGGFGVAHSDTAPESEGLVDNVRELGENTEQAGQAAGDEVRDSRLSDTAARATETTGRVTGETASRAVSLPADTLEGTGAAESLEGAADVTGSLGESGVSGALEGAGEQPGRVVDETSRAVGDTARGAGELVTGLARTGEDVVESTDGSLRGGTTLVDSVTEGLTESARSVGVPVDGTAADETRETDDGELSTEPEGDGRGDGREEETSASADAAQALAQTEDPAWRAAAEEAAHHVSSDDGAERIHLIAGGGQYSVGTDATGASSPTFPAPGAAGFLTARAGHTAPRAQRVVLPGDPTVVVRDAADDPSYTPD